MTQQMPTNRLNKLALILEGMGRYVMLMVLWFYGFVVLRLYGFMASTIHQISIPCFQEDIDPISKIFKTSLDESSGFSGAPLVNNCKNLISILDIHENNMV